MTYACPTLRKALWIVCPVHAGGGVVVVAVAVDDGGGGGGGGALNS